MVVQNLTTVNFSYFIIIDSCLDAVLYLTHRVLVILLLTLSYK